MVKKAAPAISAKKTTIKKVAPVVEKAGKIKKTASEMRVRRLSRRFHKLKVTKDSSRGILYVGHLPKGFNETELKNFFQQFGQVTKLRVSRSVKTARSRGYAFLEFAEKKVAEIAARAMNNYLLFGRQLDVHIMEEDSVHKNTFRDGNRDWTFKPTKEIFRGKKNSEKSDADRKARVSGLLNKEKEKRDRLKELEIDYKFPGYAACVGSVVAGKKSTKAPAAAVAAPAPAKKSSKKVAEPTPAPAAKVTKAAASKVEAKKEVVAAKKSPASAPSKSSSSNSKSSSSKKEAPKSSKRETSKPIKKEEKRDVKKGKKRQPIKKSSSKK